MALRLFFSPLHLAFCFSFWERRCFLPACFLFLSLSFWENRRSEVSSWLFTFLMYDTQSTFLFRSLRTVKGHEIISEDFEQFLICGGPTSSSAPLKRAVAHRIRCAGHCSFVRVFRHDVNARPSLLLSWTGKALAEQCALVMSADVSHCTPFPLRKDA